MIPKQHMPPPPDTTAVRTHRLLFNPTAAGSLPDDFPFGSIFSLLPLIEQWRRMSDENPAEFGAVAEAIEAHLEKAPELLEPIREVSLMRKHAEIVDMLLEPVFPNQAWTNDLRALGDPFGHNFFYWTPRIAEVLRLNNDGDWTDSESSTLYTRMLYAYKAILHKYYDCEMALDQPAILVIPDAEKGLDRYFKLNAMNRYSFLRNRKPLPVLSPSELDYLLHHIDDMALWMERIPPDHFEFVGFGIMTLVDVTNEVATASLKDILLTNGANVTEENFGLIEREIRTLFRKPHVELGLASIQGNGALNFQSERKIWNSLRIKEAMKAGSLDLKDSIYESVLLKGRLIAIGDLQDWPVASQVKTYLLEQGVRSILVTPLHYDGRIVGLLELSSSQPGDFHAMATLKLKQIESIFALAIHQNLEHFENRIQSVIQETYTAIHPTVAWRFREAAVTMLEGQKKHEVVHPDSIVFSNLYPLYASADIRDSSLHRNEAVRADLIEHLGLARVALTSARAQMPLTLIDELCHRIDQRIEGLQQNWGTGDESEVIEFIKKEINPLLSLLRQESSAKVPAIDTYFDQICSDEGLLLKRREAYEASLQRINDEISEILEQEQAELQQIFPHYFEKHKTDGIEHMIYLGTSLVPGRVFDLAFLRNLRLRQLAMCCEIARQVSRLKTELAVPLDVAQLVLVQDTPLTIRFRLEEKRFDVDGAYSVRYEIIKKRIDKVRLKGSEERVTQPDQIAIIYSLEQEAAEYLRYINFLQAHGVLKGEVEQLELEDLQGVSGLKALRLQVNLDTPKPEAEDMMDAAKRLVLS